LLTADRLRDHSLLDVVGRWSDDEYLVLLPGRGAAEGEQFAGLVRDKVRMATVAESPTIDCRYAVTEARRGDDQTDVLARLDLALFRAREGQAHHVEIM